MWIYVILIANNMMLICFVFLINMHEGTVFYFAPDKPICFIS